MASWLPSRRQQTTFSSSTIRSMDEVARMAETVDAARKGSVSHLTDLLKNLDTQCSGDILDALLCQLNPLPDSGSLSQERFERVACGLSGVQMMCGVYRHRPDDQVTIRTRLQAHVKGIAAWMLACAKAPAHLATGFVGQQARDVTNFQLPTMCNYLFNLHTTLRMSLLTTPEYLDLLLYYWCSKDDAGEPYSTLGLGAMMQGRCVLAAAFMDCLEMSIQLKPAVKIVDRIQVLKISANADKVVEAAVFRAQWMLKPPQRVERQITLELSAEFVGQMIDISKTLVIAGKPPILMDTPDAYTAAVVKAGVFREFGRALSALSLQRTSGVSPGDDGVAACVASTRDLFKFCHSLGRYDTRNLRDALDAGALQPCLQGIPLAKSHTAIRAPIAEILKILTEAAIWPKVMFGLSRELSAAPTFLRAGLPPDLYGMWSALLTATRYNQQVFNQMPRRMSVCDNIHHLEDTNGKTKYHAKACSGCHLFVYCSKACQVKDWKPLHKRECPIKDEDWLIHISLGRRYRPLHRLYHLELMMSIYKAQWPFIKRELAHIEEKDVVAILDFREVPDGKFDASTVFPRRPVDFQRVTASKQSAPRLKEILKMLLENKKNGWQMVEGAFRTGVKDVWLLAVVKPEGKPRGGEQEWTVVNTFTHYLTVGVELRV